MEYFGTVRYTVQTGHVGVWKVGNGLYIDPTPDELEKILPIIDVLRVAGFDNNPRVSVSLYPNKDAYVYFDIDHDYNIITE
jgi:hypothetical protein